MHNDSQSAQKLIANSTYHKRSKHIEDMCADVPTKSLNFVKHNKFVKLLGLH